MEPRLTPCSSSHTAATDPFTTDNSPQSHEVGQIVNLALECANEKNFDLALDLLGQFQLRDLPLHLKERVGQAVRQVLTAKNPRELQQEKRAHAEPEEFDPNPRESKTMRTQVSEGNELGRLTVPPAPQTRQLRPVEALKVKFESDKREFEKKLKLLNLQHEESVKRYENEMEKTRQSLLANQKVLLDLQKQLVEVRKAAAEASKSVLQAKSPAQSEHATLNLPQENQSVPLHEKAVPKTILLHKLVADLGNNSDLKPFITGQNVNSRDAKQQTPLHVAVLNMRGPNIINTLLDSGAEADLQDINGNTPLHLALMRDTVPAIRILVDRGAKTDIKNEAGKTAYELARAKDSKILGMFPQPKKMAAALASSPEEKATVAGMLTLAAYEDENPCPLVIDEDDGR